MIYLGLHNDIDSGAALIIHDKIVGAVSEERFVRVKGYKGFPYKSIDYLLNEANIKLEDVDCFIYTLLKDITPSKDTLYAIMNRVIDGVKENPELSTKYFERVKSEIEFNQKHVDDFMYHVNKLNIPKDKIYFADHHGSHACGAYYTSRFKNAFIFTSDGKGGFLSSSVWKGEKSDLKLLDYQTTFDSVGYFYSNITKALGFKEHRHEGKITGLAAYGDPEKFKNIVDNMISVEGNTIKGKLGDYYLPWFCEEESLPKLYEEVKKYKREDVSAAAQSKLEEVICKWIENNLLKHIDKDEKVDVCLSGGIFANVKLNQRVKELKNVNNLYIYPAMGDLGLPLGGIFYQMLSENDNNLKNFPSFIQTMYLGAKFSDEDAILEFKKHDLEYTRVKSIAYELKRLFDLKKPVGFFRGEMEYGPRALGHRSIFYHAKDKTVNDWLNHKLNRSEFMPFAPITTLELADKCFINWSIDDYCSDFMTITYDCTEEFIEKCSAAVHVDKTARPQIVRKESDPILHAILTEYFTLTGELAILNTSFNNHEEPIVCSVEDAIKSYNLGNVDALLIEDLLVER